MIDQAHKKTSFITSNIRIQPILIFLEKKLVYLLFFFMLAIALLTFKEYGVSLDEPIQRTHSIINLDYITGKTNELTTYQHKQYGVVVTLPLLLLEKVLQLSDSRDIYLMRHLAQHVLFLFAALFLFKLVDFLYQNKTLATIAFFMLVLHPRIYGHSFMNPKDIPFLSFFIFCLYQFAIAFNQKSIKNFLILGILIALTSHIRLIGLLLFAMSLLFLYFDYRHENKSSSNIQFAILFSTSTIITFILTAPYLWANPIINLIESLTKFSQYPICQQRLMMAITLKTCNTSILYIAGWFLSTTPILYITIGFISSYDCINTIRKKPREFISNTKARNQLLFLVCFFAPIILPIILGSTLYDGWRHLYFIYPAFILLTIFGLNKIIKKQYSLTVGIFTTTFITISISMSNLYPFESLYFNTLFATEKPENFSEHWDYNYWHISGNQALEYILKHDKSSKIRISSHSINLKNAYLFLDLNDRKRVEFANNEKEVEYYIERHLPFFKFYQNLNPLVWHRIQRNNNTIATIFKMKQ